LGSALASIGLTIPVVAILCAVNGMKINLGIDLKNTLLLMLSLFVISISFNTNKTNVQQGVVLLVLFATYLFITIVP
jgi:Ca2+:H+ antiporter